MDTQNTNRQLRYLEEVRIPLHRAGFETLPLEGNQLPVLWNGAPLCRITGKGSVFYRREDVDTPQAEDALYRVEDIAAKTLEYMTAIESAATSREEIGNPVYPPARRKLAEHGISCDGHAARQLTNQDYDKYDLLIGMDSANLRNMYRICGGDFAGKLHLLMDYTDHPRDVADPWYTEDFESTWRDVLEGCQGLLRELLQE